MVIRKLTQFFMSTKEPNEEEESRVSSVDDNFEASQSQRPENSMGEDLVGHCHVNEIYYEFRTTCR